MTIKDCVDQWVTMSDDIRVCVGSELLKLLCPISIRQLRDFEMLWIMIKNKKYPNAFKNIDAEFNAFLQEQKLVLTQCVEMEVSPLGHKARTLLGLVPIAWTDHIPEEAEITYDRRPGSDRLEIATEAETSVV